MRALNPLNHSRIESEHFIDRYLSGRLPEEEEALFEEHLFACADCLAEVRSGEDMRRGLRAVAVEDATRAALAVGLWAFLRRRGGALVSMVALTILGTAFWAQRTELSRLRSAEPGIDWTRPTGAVQTVSLGQTRTADIPRVELDRGKSVLLLSLELDAVQAEHYRVVLFSEDGDELWRGGDLEPNLYDALAVAVPSDFLEAGVYRLRIEPGDDGDAQELFFLIAAAK